MGDTGGIPRGYRGDTGGYRRIPRDTGGDRGASGKHRGDTGGIPGGYRGGTGGVLGGGPGGDPGCVGAVSLVIRGYPPGYPRGLVLGNFLILIPNLRSDQLVSYQKSFKILQISN